MNTVKVSPKFQVVIPQRVRSSIGLKAGDRLNIFSLEGRIELVPVQSPQELRGFASGINTSVEREKSDRV